MLKKFSVLVSLIFVFSGVFAVFVETGDARRLGGGRSFGSSSGYQRSVPRQSLPQKSPGVTSQRATQGQAQPGAMASRGIFGGIGGMVSGLIMGSLIGSLLFGGGMGAFKGFGLFDLLIFGLMAYLLYRMVRSRRSAAAQAAGYGGLAGTGSSREAGSQPVAGGWGGLSAGESAEPKRPLLPEGFDEKSFLEGAKKAYARLQEAWNKRDLEDIRLFAVPEVFEEIERQARESKDNERTEIILVNADLLEARELNGKIVASVLFDVMMRENASQEVPEQVREIWHFSKAKSEGAKWMLEGIQQVE
ncbi:Tim44 domain-containing protein [Desulfoglaeba alkanexedens]|jgi:predicted lipid-binding transport protein (Tim44 family)|nr:Tim44-like domain-containing protein [Desulfoglaeba alkanexedens]